ncbi:unnamed protein product [Spirodela intermedia]|uniref:E3 ubiquitin-protein ligase RMA n=1 Tax=Spirodela intermedia TaxID=51605 RepID=A0A7I8IQB8_SPIIN|nr:unnamed protein product [Spirodela intermedia]CAA6659191.1 unnamed protein product [Spirodela intermedia]
MEDAPEPLHREPSSSEASAEISGKNKASDEALPDEGLEEEDDDGDGAASALNFECNICLELAKEPVVTPCGHLFCWPCMYQWLHLHCHYNECPVCKGDIRESTLVPIYGRGSSGSRTEEVEDGDSGLKIPPGPMATGRRAGGRDCRDPCRGDSAQRLQIHGGRFLVRMCRLGV